MHAQTHKHTHTDSERKRGELIEKDRERQRYFPETICELILNTVDNLFASRCCQIRFVVVAVVDEGGGLRGAGGRCGCGGWCWLSGS